MKALTLLLTLTTTLIGNAACALTDTARELSSDTLTSPRIIEFKSDAMGFDTKNYFYVSDKEVVAIDAQFTPELAKASIEHLRRFTDKPITWLIITHPNPDKFNGASVFIDEGAKVIASEATTAAMAGVHA